MLTCSAVSTRFVRLLGDLCAPPLCPLCRAALAQGQAALCPDCEADLPQAPERRCHGCGGANPGHLALCPECLHVGARPWDFAVSAFPFHGLIRDAIHCYKYRRRTSLAPFFARCMAEAWTAYAKNQHIDAVTPVPLHWFRAWQRGYNQAAILSRLIANQLQTNYMTPLRRVRYTRQQARMDLTQRRKNVHRAFAVTNRKAVVNQRLLLVDDVFTTGATLAAATTALLNAGAASVAVLTIARD
ncbi:MAG: ComF family protein [Lentisphaerae bacterium]|nr:ComF family protein [Lentisphaerota bacterium]